MTGIKRPKRRRSCSVTGAISRPLFHSSLLTESWCRLALSMNVVSLKILCHLLFVSWSTIIQDVLISLLLITWLIVSVAISKMQALSLRLFNLLRTLKTLQQVRMWITEIPRHLVFTLFTFISICSSFKAGIYVTMMFEVLRTLLMVN